MANMIAQLLPGLRNRFSTKEALTEGLQKIENAAIEHLMAKSEGMVRKIARTFGLPEALADDVLHDGTIILIEKIQDGTYHSELSAPQTYLVAICRNLLANHSRLKRPPATEQIENVLDLADNSFVEMLEFRERRVVLEKLLAQIGPACASLIALRYLDGYSDEEQLAQKLAPFSSPESLRVSRGRCMKKLSEMAKSFKF